MFCNFSESHSVYECNYEICDLHCFVCDYYVSKMTKETILNSNWYTTYFIVLIYIGIKYFIILLQTCDRVNNL